MSEYKEIVLMYWPGWPQFPVFDRKPDFLQDEIKPETTENRKQGKYLIFDQKAS